MSEIHWETLCGVFFESRVDDATCFLPTEGIDTLLFLDTDPNTDQLIEYAEQRGIPYAVSKLDQYIPSWDEAIWSIMGDSHVICIVRDSGDSEFLAEYIRAAQKWNVKKRLIIMDTHASPPLATV